MSCGLGVGSSQTLLFGEPEAGLIPPNFVFVLLGISPKWRVVFSRNIPRVFYELPYKLAAFC